MNKRTITLIVLSAVLIFGFYTVSEFKPSKSVTTDGSNSNGGILPQIAGVIKIFIDKKKVNTQTT